jgi:hypothetical protein
MAGATYVKEDSLTCSMENFNLPFAIDPSQRFLKQRACDTVGSGHGENCDIVKYSLPMCYIATYQVQHGLAIFINLLDSKKPAQICLTSGYMSHVV